MKKLIAILLSVLTASCMLLCLTGCSFDDLTAEPETEPTTEFILKDTVPENELVKYINKMLYNVKIDNPEINVEEKFGAGSFSALTLANFAAMQNGEEQSDDNGELEKLDDTLGFIKKYLLSKFSCEAPEILLTDEDAAKITAIVDYSDRTARNWSTENVTNEEGETMSYDESATKYYFDMKGIQTDEIVTDENGDVEIYEPGDAVVRSLVKDNILTVNISFGPENEAEEGKKEYADSEIIAEYFPNGIGKEYILDELKKADTAIAVNDYGVAYNDCVITYVIDMDNDRLTSVRFAKNCDIFFDAVGTGAFEELGNFELVLSGFSDTLTYTFSYEVAE